MSARTILLLDLNNALVRSGILNLNPNVLRVCWMLLLHVTQNACQQALKSSLNSKTYLCCCAPRQQTAIATVGW